MVTREANFEGQTSGTTVGVANSSAFGDDPFTLVSLTGNITLQYGTTAMHGTGGASIGAGAGGDNAFMAYGGFANARAATRAYIRLRAYPTNEFQVLHYRNGTSTTVSGVNITPTGTIKVVGDAQALLYTSTAALSLNTWYRFEYASLISATAGQIKFSAYVGDNTSALAGATYDSGTALNTGTLTINAVDLGKITSSAVTGAFDLDDYAVNDGATAFIGPFAQLAPTPKAVVTTGSAVIDCTGSTVGQTGDTLTFSIAPSTGTSQPARGIFIVPQGSSAVTYTVTVAESNGQSKTVTAVVPAQSTSTDSVPKVFKGGQWT